MRTCPACGRSLDDRPRSTGPRSQNHRLNGYIQQIAVETGETFDTVKWHVKKEAVTMGYPFTTSRWGEVVPKSEARATVAECSLLIDEVERLAAELGIVLREEV